MSYGMNQPRGMNANGGRTSQTSVPDMRNGSYGSAVGRPGDDRISNQDRAARFEDEKKRIIESCFFKRDPDGTQLESYITHVRVTEDAMYPSAPPPANSPPANKKGRVILVAVRRSGKVRVHKARENPNGSFSIGKTWNLDELTAIQSYAALSPSSQQENTEKQWAGTTGFLVTLGKPYYWQASTSKEKDFFIASLTKIFRKYTGGRAPQLTGFAPQELDLLTTNTPGSTPLMGGASPNQISSPGLPSPVPTPPSMPAAQSLRPQSPLAPRAPSRLNDQPDSGFNRTYGRPGYRPETREGPRVTSEDSSRSPAKFPPQQIPNVDARNRSFGEQPSHMDPLKPTGSWAEMSQPLRPSASPKPSISSLQQREKISELPAARPNGLPTSIVPDGPRIRNLSVSRSQESVAAASDYSMPSRPSTSGEKKPPEPVPPMPSINNDVPDRLRPHIGSNKEASRSEKSLQSLQSDSASQFVTPAASPGATRHDTKSDEPEPLKLSKTSNAPTNLISAAATVGYFATKSSTERKDSGASMQKPPDLPAPHVISDSPVTPVDNNVVTSPDSIRAPDGETSPRKEEEYRPGLGPMIKKKSTKDIANQFRKAALAASAFQPRSGGAGARLKALQDKNSNEPDGITGVVPAPLLRGMSTDSVGSQTPSVTSPPVDKERPRTPLVSSFLPKVQLQRTATDDSAKAAGGAVKPMKEPKPVEIIEPPEPVRSGSPERKKRQRHEAEVEKFCTILSVDPRVMEGRGADFNEILTEFGWEGRLPEKQKMETFENAIRRENGRAQAAGWLGHVEQQDIRVADLSKAFDKAIAECEEMDGLLTLYSHELDTLAEDIEYIEAQSQGLQVQTANQKLLQAELQSLLKTLTISSSELRALQSAPLDSPDGVQSIEKSLLTLYKALLTIDPEIRQNKNRKAAATSNDRTGVGVYADQEIGQMRAVMQKKEDYREETLQFLRRFNQHMTAMFKQAEQRTSEDNSRSLASASLSSLSLPSLQASRQELWPYSAMMRFVREVNSYEWSTLISSYGINIKNAYVDNFREYTSAQRKNARKPAGEELEALFTHQEKDKADESLTSTAARKLTVKRGKTVKAGGLRQTFERRDGKPDAWEIFDTVLQDQAKLVAEEQNFIVHYFHLNSLATGDFVDNVGTKTSTQRAPPSLSTHLPYDPDRDMAKQVQNTVEGIYSFWTTDLQALMEWVLRNDQLQAVGVMCAIERTLAVYEETNQEYMSRVLRSLHDRLTGLFHKFIDDQIKAIEETKVKVSKRKGVIPFMRTFPVFSASVESMIPQEFYHNESLELRFILNDAYGKVLKAMWESLNFIAKDNPASGSGAQSGGAPASGDPEDKEALNYHILLIENMNHYLEEVETHNNMILDEWRTRAQTDMYKHLTQYIDAVIRRPMGKWLDFLESTEALMKTHESSPTAIANKPSHSRSSAKKVLNAYDAKEVRKGIEALKKRVEKHFGDSDDPANHSAGKSLISKVLEECNVRYDHAYDRMQTIVDQVYEGNLEIDWKKADVAALYKR